MILPAGFPGYEKYNVEHAHDSPEDLGPCLVLSFPAVQVHLRTNDYYMGMQPFRLVSIVADDLIEMSVNIDMITGRISEHCYNASVFSTSNKCGLNREKIVIDGMLTYPKPSVHPDPFQASM